MAKRAKALLIKVQNSDGIKTYTLDTKNNFSLGYKPDNTIQTYGDRVPARLKFVQPDKYGFKLKVQDGMKGEIITDDCPLSIPDLIKHRLLPREKDGYVLYLTEDKKADIRFNNLNFHIEFDRAAQSAEKEIAYWKFSQRFYRRLTTDLLFKSILLILFAFGGFVSYKINRMPFVETNKVNIEQYTRHVARIVIKPKNQAPVTTNSNIGVAGKRSEKKQENKDKPAGESRPAKTKEANKAAVKAAVMKKGLLGLIAGKGKSKQGGTVIESLVDKGLVKELDDILKSGQNLEVELPSLTDVGGNLDDLLSTSSLEVDSLISGMGVDDAVQLKEKGEVSLESFGDINGSDVALGYRSEQSIRDDINKYKNRVTYTYNKYLKLDPDLNGKVIIEIVIEASGTVSSSRVISSTVQNQKFVNELKNIVSQFHFKAIPEGQVTVENPFVFVRRDT